MIVSGGVMALLDPHVEGNLPPPWFGLTERINGYGLMLWMILLAFILLRIKPESSSLED
jgi:hypothetical protein